MKVLLSVALWGRRYSKTFVECSLASMLAEGNVPKLAKEHDVVYHIMTTRKDGVWLQRHPMLHRLQDSARVDWDFLEDHGYKVRPAGRFKYPFLSVLQNVAIAKSLEYDALVFNYADFVWSNGSLAHAIDKLNGGVDAVLSFCLPVDMYSGRRELKRHRKTNGPEAGVLELAPRTAADIAIRRLHREAKLRYWDDPDFTLTPTYLIWPVEREGVVVRAYHQTILALRVKRDDPAYRNGIPGGSLDGYFTTLLAERAVVCHAGNSDEVMVFSLYETVTDSRIDGRNHIATRADSLRECLRTAVSPGQRGFALEPIEVRRAYERPAAWSRVAQDSLQVIQRFHDTTAFDAEEYRLAHTHDMTLTELAERWRLMSQYNWVRALPGRLYRGLRDARALYGVTWLLKRLLGPARARAVRLALEALVYNARSRER